MFCVVGLSLPDVSNSVPLSATPLKAWLTETGSSPWEGEDTPDFRQIPARSRGSGGRPFRPSTR
jgi:hypothetical protein